jgi:hypothetical protein
VNRVSQNEEVCDSPRTITGDGWTFSASRARVDVTPDPKPVRVEKPRKPLRKTRGFRSSPRLAEAFRFAVLHEFGGRCILPTSTTATARSIRRI